MLYDAAMNTKNMVTLMSGVEVDSASEEWRTETLAREIEARAVLSFATRDLRRAYLVTCETAKGREYRDRLEMAVLELFEARKRS